MKYYKVGERKHPVTTMQDTRIGCYKMMLVFAPPYYKSWRLGYYLDVLEEWRVEGSNSPVNVTYFALLPDVPVEQP